MIKLVFPNGEHEQIDLKPGDTVIGSDPACQVVINANGIAKRHACISINEKGARIGVDDATNITRVNGSLVAAKTRIKGGDALLFASVLCQVVGDAPAAAPGSFPPAQAAAPESDGGRTVIRMAVPKFILRGVSGSTFGKNFPLHGSTIIGRHSECDICLAADEVSRRHAKIEIAADGLYVEDMDSANGTFINGKRVKRAKLEPGDELKLDTVRFLIQVPGQETTPKPQDDRPTAQSMTSMIDEAQEPESGGSSMVKWAVIVTVLIAGAAAGLKFAGIV